jgi:DNA-binding transcriptional LysR family regulator
MEWSSAALRVLRTVAQYESFTAAAVALGYSQSAVSRQVAALERAAGAPLFVRRPDGVRLTAAGAILLRHASIALDEVERAERLLHGKEPTGGTVRLGVFVSVGAVLIPQTVALMSHRCPDVEIVSVEGLTPALTRSLRAGTLDLAVISSRPPYPAPDDQDPPLTLDVLLEGDLLVAVPAAGPLGSNTSVTLAELQAARWIVSPQTPPELGLGVWPALAQRPVIGHQARDWLSKLAMVAAGLGVTTIPPYLISLIPDNVRLVRVSNGAPVSRRVLLARAPGVRHPAVTDLAECLQEAAAGLPLS